MKNRLPILLMLVVAWGVPTLLTAQTYNVYFGDIHSQTWYSDGNADQDTNTYKKPVAKAITYARDVAGNMDFLGISDHNHNETLNMTLGRWRAGHFEADSVNQDGNFVGLYGQEWGTISTGGHALIYGTDKLFGWNPGIYDVFVAKGDYGSLFTAIKSNGGFCYLAHPVGSDYDGIFTGAYNANWDSVVMGVAMKNGPAFSTSTTETDPASGSYIDRYNDLLKKGYHIAPAANQDNHNTNFGRSNQQRTAVLATSLTKANVLDALRNRRTYATEDHNLKVWFESGTHAMGELITVSGSVPLRVKASDADGSNLISKIEIRYGVPGSGSVPTLLTSVNNIDSLIYSQAQTNNTTYYYYAYVLETNGRQAWSAPIWVTTTTAAAPSAFSQTAPANSATSQAVSGTLTWQTSANAIQYDVYLDGNNPPTTLVSSNQAGTSYNYSGLSNSSVYYWKIVAENGLGTADATGAPWSFTTVVASPSSFTQSSPSNTSSNQPVAGTLSWQTSANAVNYDVYLDGNNPPTTVVSSNQAGTSYNYSGLSNLTVYFWKIVAKNAGGNVVATGAPWTFLTIVAAPGSFNQSSPSNSSVNQLVAGSLSWQASANAATYDVYLDQSNPPTTVISSNQAGTTYNYSGLLNSAVYYWKIVAKNAAGDVVATGAPWTFTTAVAAPGTFVLNSPSDNATAQPLSGTLNWNSSPNVVTYDVVLDINSPPTNVFAEDVADTTYVYTGLSIGTTYYWKIVAQNTGGTTTASNAPRSFITVNVPSSATNFASSNLTTTSLDLSWTDNASDETGYRVYRSTSAGGPFSQMGSDLPVNTVSFSDAGLNINQRYYYRVTPFNAIGEGNYTAINLATLAEPPGTPALSDVNYITAKVTIDPASNSAETEFAIEVIHDFIPEYIQANGSPGVSPIWRTFTQWGDVSGVSLNSLHTCTEYTFQVKARNLDNIETSVSTGVSDSMLCFIASASTQSGWNLVSLPVTVPDPQRTIVFPTSTSNAFSYEGSYVTASTLSYGKGYWLKFNTIQNIDIPGEPRTLDSVSVNKGWQMIGSISASVPVGSVSSSPASIIVSPFYSYDGSYHTASSIEPMSGYWVKTNAAGKIIFSGSLLNSPKNMPRTDLSENIFSGFNTLTFEDKQGHKQTLHIGRGSSSLPDVSAFELPPVPPSGFDVRFGSQQWVEFINEQESGNQEFPILVHASEYPVTLSWNFKNDDGIQYQFAGIASKDLSASGKLLLNQNTILVLKAAKTTASSQPKEFALYQNYPNPFNPSTEIRYDLPAESFVRLTVYNVLGVKVAALFEGKQGSGSHRIDWRPEMASGLYFYRLEASRIDDPSKSFQQVRRMLLMK